MVDIRVLLSLMLILVLMFTAVLGFVNREIYIPNATSNRFTKYSGRRAMLAGGLVSIGMGILSTPLILDLFNQTASVLTAGFTFILILLISLALARITYKTRFFTWFSNKK